MRRCDSPSSERLKRRSPIVISVPGRVTDDLNEVGREPCVVVAFEPDVVGDPHNRVSDDRHTRH